MATHEPCAYLRRSGVDPHATVCSPEDGVVSACTGPGSSSSQPRKTTLWRNERSLRCVFPPGMPCQVGRSTSTGRPLAMRRRALRTGSHLGSLRAPSARLRSRCERSLPTDSGSLRTMRRACSEVGLGGLLLSVGLVASCWSAVCVVGLGWGVSSGCRWRRTSTTRTSTAALRAPSRLREASLRHRDEHQMGRRPTPR